FAAVGHIHPSRVATEREPVCTRAGRYEANRLEAVAVDFEHTVGFHVRDVEDAAVGREPDVLWHRVVCGQAQGSQERPRRHIQLDQFSRKLAAGDEIPAVRGKVGMVYAPAWD